MSVFGLVYLHARNGSLHLRAVCRKSRQNWTPAAESSDEDLAFSTPCSGTETFIECPSQDPGPGSLNRRHTGTQASASLHIRNQRLLGARPAGKIEKTQYFLTSSKLRDHALCKDPQHSSGAGLPTSLSVLSSFQKVNDLSNGKLVHGYVIRSGLERNGLVVNLLIQMYAKYGALETASALFFEMSERSLSAWNTMIRTHSQFGQPNDALQLFEQMQNEGVVPNKYVFVSILSACLVPADLAEGTRLHSRIMDSGYQSDVVVGTAFVNMYGKCGNMNYAKVVFDSISERDTVSWNCLIAAHAQHVQGKEALQLYDRMLQEGLLPNKRTFVSVLDACATEVATVQGNQMHACIMARGLDIDVMVVTSLVYMHGKCCNLDTACRLFVETDVLDVVLWNTMIGAYIQNGNAVDALHLIERMKLRGILPDKVTLISSLSACTSTASLLLGRQVHILIISYGFELIVDVDNALISMYSKCSRPEEAWSVFSRMSKWDIFSWSSVLGAYAQNGQVKKCLEVLDEMQKEGIVANKVTFVSMIDVCASQAALNEGALFTFMPERDLVSWNAMITSYAQNRQIKDALQLVDQMQLEGFRPDKVTLTTLLSACTSQATLSEGKQIEALIMASEFKCEPFLATSLINMYSKCKSLEDARSLFNKMHEKDTLVWNAMISACVQNGHAGDALLQFDQMRLEGEAFDNASYAIFLSVCSNQMFLAKGKQIHAVIAGCGSELDAMAWAAVINMYGRCGMLEDARRVFEEVINQDVSLWNTMISLYADNKRSSDALQLFSRMQEEGFIADKDTIVCAMSACSCKAALIEAKLIHSFVISSGWELHVDVVNALLSMYDKCENLLYAIKMFGNIPELSKSVLVSILSACARHGAVSEGRQFHAQIMASGYELDVLIGNALINMYGKCASLEDAWVLFKTLPETDVVSWTALISAYAQSGMVENALQLFDKMQLEGVIPNKVTLVSILAACSHTGMVEHGCHQFLAMNQDHGITPIPDHYHCMIDLLGRAGRLKEAESLINSMPFQANTVSWTTLLSACRNQIDVQQGQQAANKALELDPESVAPYVMLSNIYAMAETI